MKRNPTGLGQSSRESKMTEIETGRESERTRQVWKVLDKGELSFPKRDSIIVCGKALHSALWGLTLHI